MRLGLGRCWMLEGGRGTVARGGGGERRPSVDSISPAENFRRGITTSTTSSLAERRSTRAPSKLQLVEKALFQIAEPASGSVLPDPLDRSPCSQAATFPSTLAVFGSGFNPPRSVHPRPGLSAFYPSLGGSRGAGTARILPRR